MMIPENDTLTEIAEIFKVLSVDTRLKIVLLVKTRCLCVGALARRLNITPAAVSQHLRILKDAGIIKAERRGNFIHYQMNEKMMTKLIEIVTTIFVSDSETDVPTVFNSPGSSETRITGGNNQ